LGKGIKTGFAASAGGLVKEGFNSVKLLLGNSQFLLPTATGLLITSTESSFMFKYSQKRSDEYMRSFGLNTIFVPVASTTTVALTGFLLRINSKKFTKLMGGETNPATCKRIMGLSLATTAVGGAIMYTSNSPVGFYSGLAITSLGLANGFNGALLMGVDNLKAIKAPAELITSYKATFPIAQLGQAGGSLIFSNHADNLVQEDKSLSRNNALQKSLWIPFGFLGGASVLTGMSAGVINKKNLNILSKIPAGGWAIAKGITSNGYDAKPFRPTEVLPAAQNPSLSVFRDYQKAKDPQLLKVNYAMPKITYAQDASTL
jgi:hypothetical protein